MGVAGSSSLTIGTLYSLGSRSQETQSVFLSDVHKPSLINGVPIDFPLHWFRNRVMHAKRTAQEAELSSINALES